MARGELVVISQIGFFGSLGIGIRTLVFFVVLLLFPIKNLLAYWKLDESSGSVATDSSGLGNDATYVGSPALGAVGAFPTATNTSVLLNGSSQSVTSGVSLLNDAEEFTISGWFNTLDLSPEASFLG